MPQRISVNNFWIADLAIFRELINNDQRATTTPLSVGTEFKVVPLSILAIQSLFIGKL